METQYISLNMTPSGVNPIFHISQYDVGRLLGFYVYNGSEVVDLDDYTCTVEATRTDGTQITTNVITNNNSGIFAVTATMSNVADKYNCQLVIVDRNANRVASLPFIMDVVTAALNGNDSSIYDDRSLYQQYTASMQAALANEANNRINADNLEKATRQSAVNTLQGNINSEVATRASADSNLQSQINQIVAPSGEAPSAAEVQNARIGANGVTYDTLGTAIRSQVNDIKENIDNVCVNETLSSDLWESGEWLPNGKPQTATDVIRTKDYIPYDIIMGIVPPSGYKILLVAYLDGIADGYVKGDGTHSQISPGFQFFYDSLENKYQYKAMMYNPSSSTITASEGKDVNFKVLKNEVELKKLKNINYALEIIPIDKDHFKVKGYDKSHEKYIYHYFTHDLVNQTIDGNNIKTMDVWYADEIKDENENTIMQGNTNFIHNLANDGHTGYVGAGDGCAVSEFSLFFADGVRIYPEELQRTLPCNEFRYTAKVNHYLSSGNTQYTGVIPLLISGKPIVESVNDIDFSLTSDNEMHHRNRLTINFNGAKFSECHGAMCAGFYPYFNNVILNNKEFSWNKINDDLTVEKMGATTLNLSTDGWVKADTVIMFGEKYRCTNRIIQCNPSRYGKTNIRPWFPPNNDNRIKMYMMPVVCTISKENLADGDTVEVFNVGDVIDVDVYRKIDIS